MRRVGLRAMNDAPEDRVIGGKRIRPEEVDDHCVGADRDPQGDQQRPSFAYKNGCWIFARHRPPRGESYASTRTFSPVAGSPSSRFMIASATTSGGFTLSGSSPGKASARMRVRVAPGSTIWTRRRLVKAVSSA